MEVLLPKCRIMKKGEEFIPSLMFYHDPYMVLPDRTAFLCFWEWSSGVVKYEEERKYIGKI